MDWHCKRGENISQWKMGRKMTKSCSHVHINDLILHLDRYKGVDKWRAQAATGGSPREHHRLSPC